RRLPVGIFVRPELPQLGDLVEMLQVFMPARRNPTRHFVGNQPRPRQPHGVAVHGGQRDVLIQQDLHGSDSRVMVVLGDELARGAGVRVRAMLFSVLRFIGVIRGGQHCRHQAHPIIDPNGHLLLIHRSSVELPYIEAACRPPYRGDRSHAWLRYGYHYTKGRCEWKVDARVFWTPYYTDGDPQILFVALSPYVVGAHKARIGSLIMTGQKAALYRMKHICHVLVGLLPLDRCNKGSGLCPIMMMRTTKARANRQS